MQSLPLFDLDPLFRPKTVAVVGANETTRHQAVLILMMFASANRAAVSGISPLLREWRQRKPVISCLMGPPGIWEDEVLDLEQTGALVNFPTPERAAGALAALHRSALLRDRVRMRE